MNHCNKESNKEFAQPSAKDTKQHPCARVQFTTAPYTDVMIDIEALADLPDSAPAEIALVFFDRDHPDKHFCCYRYTPSPMSAMRLGFSITAATLQWWDDHAMTIAVQQGEPLLEVLDEIEADIRRHTTRGLRVWSRGNSYDLAILKLAYHRGNKKVPWDFWNERDVRTWLESLRFKSPRSNNHNALDDANNQARDVVEAGALFNGTIGALPPLPSSGFFNTNTLPKP